MIFDNKKVLITGGTGSLGRHLVKTILTDKYGKVDSLTVFSRDEDKQYNMEIEWKMEAYPSHAIFYQNADKLHFKIGDVRDYESVVSAIKESDIVIHATALKQVPIGEFFPWESIKTNIIGTQNIIRAIAESNNHVKTMLTISTDKACKPVNTYGMCKAIQERLTVEANMLCPECRFICVRYGNVAASRGSVIPLFREQIKNDRPITITTPEMTRFVLTLETATQIVFDAIETADAGDIYVPDIPAMKILDLAYVMIGNKKIDIRIIGIRPGEKIHELLISEEEILRTIKRGKYYVIQPVLPQMRKGITEFCLGCELSSADRIMTRDEIKTFVNSIESN